MRIWDLGSGNWELLRAAVRSACPLNPELQACCQLAPAHLWSVVADCYGEGFARSDHDEKLLSAGHAGVDQVTLKHDVVLG